jgi:signal peptidase I
VTPAGRVRLVITGVLFAVPALFLVGWFAVGARQYYIPSEAMKPTLTIGSHVWSSRMGASDPQPGDLVVYTAADNPDIERISRVVAIGGQTIESVDGNVSINGQRRAEPYLEPGTPTQHLDKTTVPGGSVYLLGDNRTNSKDSRFIGPVPIDQVHLRAFLAPAPNVMWIVGAAVLFGLTFGTQLLVWRRGATT